MELSTLHISGEPKTDVPGATQRYYLFQQADKGPPAYSLGVGFIHPLDGIPVFIFLVIGRKAASNGFDFGAAKLQYQLFRRAPHYANSRFPIIITGNVSAAV